MEYRETARKLIGEDRELEVFSKTTDRNYAYVVRRVLEGSTIEEALHPKPLLEEQKVYEILEGDTVCPKCKSRRIIKKEMQTRSCDESATTFCQCVNCKHRFKF